MDAYTGTPTVIFTQPAVTRDPATGLVTNRPRINVSEAQQWQSVKFGLNAYLDSLLAPKCMTWFMVKAPRGRVGYA